MEFPLNDKEQKRVDRWLEDVNYVIKWLDGRRDQYSQMHSNVLKFKQELIDICTVWQYDVMQIKATKTINKWKKIIENQTFDQFRNCNVY
ncbi:unnamed protein product [Caenorhabditis angaria]|uniref:Uncharacterized protein n=1 Tax=Caenorhabditis angaria TaxID=860376 RepID=A0A9P1N903_9PELO|nr:unnamed protein product [Caenorhabditis angaria]